MKDIDDTRIHKSIAEGRPGTAMVAWKGTLKPADKPHQNGCLDSLS